jgi:hypothetical protein
LELRADESGEIEVGERVGESGTGESGEESELSTDVEADVEQDD